MLRAYDNAYQRVEPGSAERPNLLWRPRPMLQAAAAFVSARQQRPARAFGVKQHPRGRSAPGFPQIIHRTEILEHVLRGADACANALESRAFRALEPARAIHAARRCRNDFQKQLEAVTDLT